MPPGSGSARWNPRAQRWEEPEELEWLEWLEEEERLEAERTEAGAGLPPMPAYPPGSAPDDAPAGPAPARRRAGRWWIRSAVALGVVAVLGGAALGASYLLADPEGPPDGYQVLRSAGSGFRVAVPGGWQLSTSESGAAAGTVYRPAQGRGSLLQVLRVTSGPDNPCEVLVEGSSQLSSRDGYRRLSLEGTEGRGCEIVFEVPDGETSGKARCIGRLVVASDGSRWVLLSFGPADEAKAVRVRLTAALGSFRPD
ncbi:hypothetical protein [Streptomyces sp. NBC_01205]|uniref:hypothetical protein n=1 Tax=Streptomyces sp. NBC_01205 TaxID=2903771 RepID=UPI002E13440B|nr:hypothetical protein OG573_17020 [Streptomyces sp. NBC_01205]